MQGNQTFVRYCIFIDVIDGPLTMAWLL